MNTKQQTIEKIEQLEAQLEVLKKDLEQKPLTIQEANIGDILEDGSIVLQKSNGLALLVAPQSTEVYCEWSKEFSEVFDKLSSQGFNHSQWFVPSKEQLLLAYKNCKQHFASNYYWSSAEVSSTKAWGVFFFNGFANIDNKSDAICVRAFRCVTY